MLLAVDAGNTNIVFGIYKNHEWITEWRYDTLPIKNQMEYELFLRLQFLEANLKLEDVEAVVISSVVPQLNPILTEFSKPLINREPLFIEPKLGVIITSKPSIKAFTLSTNSYLTRLALM